MYDIERAIKHFEAMQEIIVSNDPEGQPDTRIADALEALHACKKFNDIQDILYKKLLDKYSEMLAEELVNVRPIDTCVGEIRYFKPTVDKFDSAITDLKNGRTPTIQSDNTEGLITKI